MARRPSSSRHYAGRRPTLVTDWREGPATPTAPAIALAPDLAWEAELWRRPLTRVDAEPPDVRHDRVCARARAGELDGLELPDRLSLFGHTRLPPDRDRPAGRPAAHREVHLWLAQPRPRWGTWWSRRAPR